MKQPLVVFGGIFFSTALVLVVVLIYQFKGITDGGKSNGSTYQPTPPVVEDVQEEYQLSELATPYQKEIFEELLTAQKEYKTTSTDLTEEEYAAALVKNFIADFYTWSNKTGRNDVGGLQFIAEEMRSDFRNQAIDGFYGNLDYYLKDYDATTLITVKDVSVLDVNLNDTIQAEVETETEEGTEKTTESVECISVEANWEYEVSSLNEITKFQNEATFILTQSGENLVLNAILAE